MDTASKRALEQLRTYKDNRAEIIRLGVELANMRIECDSVKGSLTEYPYTPAHITIKGFNVHTAACLYKRRQRLQARQRRIEKYVEGIPDRYIRCIVELRYLEGLGWGSVARRIGRLDTSDSVRKAVKRYFSTCSDS